MRARIPGGGAEKKVKVGEATAAASAAAAVRPRYRLAYMPMRNRAEVPRLIMEEAGCPYEFDVMGFQLWKRWGCGPVRELDFFYIFLADIFIIILSFFCLFRLLKKSSLHKQDGSRLVSLAYYEEVGES